MQSEKFNITARGITIVTIRGIEQTAHTLWLDSILKISFAVRENIRPRGMSEEKQDKESKKVAERVIFTKRGDVFKNEVTADNIRKETNSLESLSRWSWPQKYEHLTGQFFSQVS